VECTDWLDEGFDPAQAQFLMVTAITHHRFSSPLWGEDEVRKLQAELAEMASAAAQIATPEPSTNLRADHLSENIVRAPDNRATGQHPASPTAHGQAQGARPISLALAHDARWAPSPANGEQLPLAGHAP
jgi:hypothetical protein